MLVRPARQDDLDEMIAVVRRSIVELCIQDHHEDPGILSEWLANKTSDQALRWISAAGQRVVVAELDGKVTGVGAATQDGRVLLNYVSPDHRGRGVSSAILASLESYMATEGVTHSRVVSTVTAREFYRKRGYADELATSGAQNGPAERHMSKQIAG